MQDSLARTVWQNFRLGWTVWPNPGILYLNNKQLLNYQYLFGRQSIMAAGGMNWSRQKC